MTCATIWHSTLVLFLLIATLCAATNDHKEVGDLAIARKHEQWMAEHGRIYEDEAERARRLEIFKDNLKFIEDFNNARMYNYTLGLNEFVDLTTEEFTAIYSGGLMKPEIDFMESLRSIKYETTTEQLNVSDIPSSVDWRTKGAVNPVINQGKCGACWSFVTCAVVEAINKIKNGELYRLSVQQLLDCDKRNLGCRGGWMTEAYKYIINNKGLTSESNYPYIGQQRRYCLNEKAKGIVATITGYSTVPKNEKALAKAVAQQPVAAAIYSKAREFHLYKSGVYEGPCQTSIDHAVTIVGYGETDDKTKYWLVKNTWGTSWGEKGYFRMKKDVASSRGTCNIATYASYPTLET
ncbi:zingipain-2-like isoform X1 [Asparagus officinalis]|uniref:zingipain-2-like isoform X1 n=1 Tax=Asparagus officinalis TaxID=4686 RepID=UPI00098E3351|nr:zingipain-2-like isoform X1 [Asparagus officinalis]